MDNLRTEKRSLWLLEGLGVEKVLVYPSPGNLVKIEMFLSKEKNTN